MPFSPTAATAASKSFLASLTSQVRAAVNLDSTAALQKARAAGVTLEDWNYWTAVDGPAILPLDVLFALSIGATDSEVAPFIYKTGTATGGSTTTLVDAAAASLSTVDDTYNGWVIATTAGTGAGQVRRVEDYVGSTRTFTVDTWTAVGADTVYALFQVPFTVPA